MKKAVIYARFSSNAQTEQSIEGQIRICKEYAKKNDLCIVNQYIDRAKTGTNDMRPSFQLMMQDCLKHEWEVVLVYKLDRFSRDKCDSAIHKRTLKKNGVKVVSATENIPDTPEAIIFESVLEGFAQYYSAELSQKVKRGLHESYLKGNFTGGYVPYGYDVVDKKIQINEYEAQVVRDIYDKYSKGYAIKNIQKYLTEHGITNKRNKPFSKNGLYRILCSEKYNGRVTHEGVVYTDIFPKIIDDITWQAMNEKHLNFVTYRGRNKDSCGYILTGKLFCGYYHNTIVGGKCRSKTGVYHHYYACRRDCPHYKTCSLKSLRQSYIEDLVMECISTMLSNTNKIDLLADKIIQYNEHYNVNTAFLNVLQDNLQDKKKQADNVMTAIRQGIITTQTKECLETLEKDISLIEFQIAEEEAKKNTTITKEKIISFLKKSLLTTTADEHSKKYLINTLIKEIIVYRGCIIIIFKYMTIDKHHFDKDMLDEIVDAANNIDTKSHIFLDESSYIKCSVAPIKKKWPFLRTIFY